MFNPLRSLARERQEKRIAKATATMKELNAHLISCFAVMDFLYCRDWISTGFLELLFTLLLVLESQPHLVTIVRPIAGSYATCKLESEENEGEVGKISPVAGESSSVGGDICDSMDMSYVSKNDATELSSFIGGEHGCRRWQFWEHGSVVVLRRCCSSRVLSRGRLCAGIVCDNGGISKNSSKFVSEEE
ncbi:hypothetical protein DKX38_004212 [Salix brachista]|uniref:Uncharacterized protein n=1 Tax=Salix brachista TaxID=2182728 RepID=A0A5N5NAR4_9ROSI|nr:hypothetical protein DKX38_004212 [Salix brachista]